MGLPVAAVVAAPSGAAFAGLFSSATVVPPEIRPCACETQTSEACAAGIAQGLTLTDAVARAWAYTAEAIRRAPGLGAGAGPLDHAWPLRDR